MNKCSEEEHVTRWESKSMPHCLGAWILCRQWREGGARLDGPLRADRGKPWGVGKQRSSSHYLLRSGCRAM